MAENKANKSNRDLYSERLKAKYPDKEFADDEALFGQINEDYEHYDNELAGYRDREKSLSDLFSSNPRAAAFLMDWRNGEDPLIGMIRKFGDDFKNALEDPENLEALAAASKEYADRIAQEKNFEQQYMSNMNETMAVIEQVKKEEGFSDGQIDEIFVFLTKIMQDAVVGKYSKESIIMAHKALNHDADVELADREGEIRGKNTRIEEKLRKKSKTDGTANLSGKSATSTPVPDLGALDRYGQGSKNIWERGGERRKKLS